jgi:drug/metabolite transporter (DMT)-like permease
MNRLESNIVLLSVSFLWGIQYIFMKDVKNEISTFAFLTLTCGIGFFILVVPFWYKLNSLTIKICFQSLILALLLVGFNILLFESLQLLEASFVSFVVNAAYLIFIMLFTFILKGSITKSNCFGVLIVIGGLALITGRIESFESWFGFAEVVVAAALFALHVLLVDKIAKNVDPLLLSIGQMFFCTIFCFLGWFILRPETFYQINMSGHFWSNVLLIAIFIRGYTTIAQIYAQRFVLPIDASLIFSLEIVFTLVTSTFLPSLIGNVSEELSFHKIIGCLVILLGLIVSSCGLFEKSKDS